jgi:type IV pilus secretin PilQ/predicted competence protein
VTITKGFALLVSVILAGVLTSASAPPAAGAGTSVVRLKTISGRVQGKSASIVIEATEPTSYVATQPDPLTVQVDFRNVVSATVNNRFVADPKSPIARVSVETIESPGAPQSRVTIALARPVTHRARADRNAVVIDFDRPSETRPAVLPPPSRTRPDAMAALGSPAAGATAPIDVLRQAPPIVVRSVTSTELRNDQAGQPTAQPQAVIVPTSSSAGAPAQVAQQPPPPPPVGQTGRPSERRFTGAPISLDFQGADLRAVLRTFSEVSGLNIVIDPKVTGTVDVAMRDVPWDQALDIILRANDLDYVIEGNIVRIAPVDVFTAEDNKRKQRADARAEAQASAEPLGTFTRQLSYAKGEDIVRVLKDARLVSKYGQAQVDQRTNTIIITDLPAQFDQVRLLVESLDKAQPQVEIEARIVQTSKTYARQLGIQWGFAGRVDPALGNTTGAAFPNNGSLTGRTGGLQGAIGSSNGQGVPTGVNLGVPGATSAVGLALGSINGAFNLDAALSALERSGNGRLLSTPRVSTQNNVEAEIAQGVQIGYQQVSNNTVTIQFKDAALVLKVLPQITAADTVIMRVSVDNGSVGEIFNNIPSINTQRANTTVQVNDGQTTVIGGIYATQENTTNDRTPGLSRVPLLKWLFKRDSIDDQSRELLIFITPRIIKG